MIKWIPYAMVRISVFFVAGILLAIYQSDILSFSNVILLLAIFATVYFLVFAFLHQYRGVLLGTAGLVIVFCCGYAHLSLQTQSRRAEHLLNVHDEITAYQGVVRSYPESKSKSWKIELEVSAIKTNEWRSAVGRVQLYISKKENAIDWNYGDHLIIQGAPRLIKPPANPGEFDFKRFLTFKNIHHQQFLKKEDFRVLAAATRKGFIYYSHQARSWASDQIRKFIPGEEEQAITMALILGVTDGIDTDLQNAYSASGAMHVLAVSGLHVGIIYAIILFLLRPLRSKAWSRWFIAIISLVCLWAFAFVTGLSPSVLRAVAMFSFVAVARPFGARTNIYNTLAASAFVLLLYNPFLIMSVGFQLSYLAVLGIVYLQKPIYRMWDIENRVGDWTWQITCISLAAQLTTFSLGLLYFHQFPVYFLVSNLFVIPLSTLILVIGIVLLLLSPITSIANLIGVVMEFLIKILNWIVFKVEELPFSLINNIQLTTFQCWLLMGILGALILLFEARSIGGCILLFSYRWCFRLHNGLTSINLWIVRNW
jgi:ComEC/Rec2-related protein